MGGSVCKGTSRGPRLAFPGGAGPHPHGEGAGARAGSGGPDWVAARSCAPAAREPPLTPQPQPCCPAGLRLSCDPLPRQLMRRWRADRWGRSSRGRSRQRAELRGRRRRSRSGGTVVAALPCSRDWGPAERERRAAAPGKGQRPCWGKCARNPACCARAGTRKGRAWEADAPLQAMP